MPDLHEDDPDPFGPHHRPIPSTDAPTPRPTGPPEVEALHALDELIGNREHLGPKSLGKVRGIVLDTLNAWHAKVRDRQQLVAGGRPSPLPSELLESCDGGQGIAAFVLSPEVLDRLPVLMRDPVPPGGFLPAAPEEPRVASMRGRRDRARDHAVRNESEAADLRRQLDEALGDADRYATVITTLEQERNEARRQLVEQGEAAEEQADALRAEVARLSGLLGERVPAADLARVRRERDDLGQQLAEYRASFDPAVEEQSLRARLVEFVANLAAEDWSAYVVPPVSVEWLLQRPRKIAASIEELVLGERVGSAEPDLDQLVGDAIERVHRESLDLSSANPARPMPGANAWPDDAVLLTYAELRRLVALHLDVCRQSMPREKPWEWITLRADSVRDGMTPLLVAEVLDR